MKTVSIALMLFLAFEPPANAQSLDEFQRGFTEECVGLGQERDRDLEKLATNYIKALQDLDEKTTQSGNLDAVLPVRDEIEAVEGSKWPLPFLSKTAPERLRELRDTYIEERRKIEERHSKRLGELVSKTTDLLKQREVELTKAGDVDGALAARETASAISNSPTNKSTLGGDKEDEFRPARVSREGLQFPVIRLQLGANIFTNRAYSFGKIPKQLTGCSFVQTKIGRPNEIEIEVESDGYLYLASTTHKDVHKENRDVLPSKGWKQCEFMIEMARGHAPMIVFSKRFPKGKAKIPLTFPGSGSTLIFAQDE